jgi:AraC-like DNA-binding protein
MDNNKQNSAKPIPLHRVAILRPFVQFLTDVGTPVEKGFRQAGLPVYALEDMNNYVPSQRFYAFLVNMACSQRIEDLGFRVGRSIGANCIDPHLAELLHRSPTLYKGLLKTAALSNKTVSNSQMWLLQLKNDTHTYFCHSPSCDANNPAIEQIGWFGMTILIQIIRMFAGPHWQPTKIGLVTNQAPDRYIHEQLGDTQVRLSQPYCYISIENELLSLPPLIHHSNKPSTPGYESCSKDFVHSLEQVLPAYIQEDELDLEFAAGLCNMSIRTLQRKLGEMGTRFSEVLDHSRFHVANRMLLQDPGMKVTDIAHRLTYSDLSHFSRSFHRVAGVSPCEYRRLHATQCQQPALLATG